MNKKIFIFAFAFLFFGFASAGREVTNIQGIEIPVSVIAGNTAMANFSYDYLDIGENTDDSPLIIQLNFTSKDGLPSVWKGDFYVDGFIERYIPWPFSFIYDRKILFNCSELATQTISHPLGAEDVYAPNGTFYCYNPEGDLELNKRDNIFLNIKSNMAIYPGSYAISASLFYLTDTYAPKVTILNKTYFNKYFRDGSNVVFNANITDGSEIEILRSVLFASEEVPFSISKITNQIYEISRTLPIEISDGDYDLFVFAEDINGNKGNDSVKIKIDRTAPSINLMLPANESILGEEMRIKVESTDAKSGLNGSSVLYRLREMNGTGICPETGVGSWSCYNSGWVTLPKDADFENIFFSRINTTQIGLNSGKYWLEIKSCDNLNNCREL